MLKFDSVYIQIFLSIRTESYKELASRRVRTRQKSMHEPGRERVGYLGQLNILRSFRNNTKAVMSSFVNLYNTNLTVRPKQSLYFDFIVRHFDCGCVCLSHVFIECHELCEILCSYTVKRLAWPIRIKFGFFRYLDWPSEARSQF